MVMRSTRAGALCDRRLFGLLRPARIPGGSGCAVLDVSGWSSPNNCSSVL